jgi:Trk K+ transport system NAD-binding subunit
VRKNKVIMPKSSVVFEKDDVVVFLSKRDQLKEIENLFRISS